ncbi:MAG: hypothetical protein WC379_01760 [Methanoregula sp.]|jgi:hypothetical protein
MTDETIEDWNFKNGIVYNIERGNILLQLRYQLAIGIMVLIAGVWTIFAPSLNDPNTNSIFIGWLLSISLVTGWRVITHFIFLEEQALSVSSEDYLHKLGLPVDDYFNRIEGHFKLNENPSYKKFDTTDKKFKLMRKLQSHLPEKGINNFDWLSIIAIMASGIVIMASGQFVTFFETTSIKAYFVIFLFCFYSIIIFDIVFWKWPYSFFTQFSQLWGNLEINEVLKDMKKTEMMENGD